MYDAGGRPCWQEKAAGGGGSTRSVSASEIRSQEQVIERATPPHEIAGVMAVGVKIHFESTDGET
jgi:hypothetical protein